VVLRALLVWLLLAVVAVTAGTLRVRYLVPRVGDPAAHVMGTLLVVAAMALVVGLTVGWIVPGLETRRLVLLGLGWTGLTVAFEFLFGHYVVGHPWSRLLADYNVMAGRIWTLVLLTSLLAPVILGRLQAGR
jgi:hypothetical protein